MKKLTLLAFSLMAVTALCARPASAQFWPPPPDGWLVCPDSIGIGDSIGIHCGFQIPGGFPLPSGTITINSFLVCGTDTLPLCSGTIQITPPDSITHDFSCEIPDTSLIGDCRILISIQTPFGPFFLPGGHPILVAGTHDIDGSGTLDIGDAVSLISFIFLNGSTPLPGLSNADLSCDQNVNVGDVVKLVGYIFLGDNLTCYNAGSN